MREKGNQNEMEERRRMIDLTKKKKGEREISRRGGGREE